MTYSKAFISDIKSRVSVSDVIGRGTKLRRDGKEFRAVDNASLTVNDVKGIWFDHATNEGGDVLAWLQKSQGLSFGDAVAEIASIAGVPLPNGNGEATPQQFATKGKITNTYDYTDADGALLYQVLRYEPKDFRQRRPDGVGGWKWKDVFKGISRVLYRWPELLKFPDATVFVAEGEKDSDRIAMLGHCATTVAGGKWTEECAQALAGRDVVILPDNDAGGHEKAAAAAVALQGKASTLRVVLLPGLTGEKGSNDVSDWFDAGHTSEELVQICLAAPEYEKREERAGLVATLKTAKASSYTMRGITWFWQNRLSIGKLALLGGLPDKGKGLIGCYLAACATNRLPLPCNEGESPQGNVLIFTAEDDPEDTVVPRLAAAGADLDRVHIVNVVGDPNGTERTFSMITDLPALEAKLEEIGNVVLVIIDPMSAYIGVGKANTSMTSDVRGFLKPLTDLAAKTKICLLGIMHFNKKADVTNAMLRIADSLAYVAAARHVYVVVDDPEIEDQRLFVKAKNNLSTDKKALSYMTGARNVGVDPDTKKEIWAPYVEWGKKHLEITATDAMQAEGNGPSRYARREAIKFLQDRLAAGPVKQKDIAEEAEGNGITKSTLKRAKQELKIKSSKGKGIDGEWMWELPEPPKIRNFHDRSLEDPHV